MRSSGSDLPPQLARTADLYGVDGVERLLRSFVVVVGLGGVGSHVAVALARSGVGRLRVVDHDLVTASSLNRHAVATAADVGRLKADVMASALEAIRPDVRVEPLGLFCAPDTLDQVLGGGPDWVVDAIDGVNTKTGLLAACVGRSLNVATCMGASCRTDPTLVRVADISRTEVCPLAARVRRRLRRVGVHGGIPTVYSVEAPLPALEPDEEDPQLGPGRRRRRLPSSSTLPGIFGYAVAGIVIESIAQGARVFTDESGSGRQRTQPRPGPGPGPGPRPGPAMRRTVEDQDQDQDQDEVQVGMVAAGAVHAPRPAGRIPLDSLPCEPPDSSPSCSPSPPPPSPTSRRGSPAPTPTARRR